MHITATEALWFLPFVLPVCLWVAWTDLKLMRIRNTAVITLAAIFVIVGPLVLPLEDYGWRLAHLPAALVIGIALNAGGLVGAGDAKFVAAAAPFIAPGDITLLTLIMAANLLAAFAAHRIAKYSGLRRLAPDWESWSRGKKFPMGLSLGGSLAIYLGLAAAYGA
ncbi:hypothetical protein DQW77_02865 [Roseovarius sp. TE539]|uniref:prepilin peptidase n=1 Tax=Roseovarius sp. TE539 TaxID=2249812 RepID=UPI000DDD0580|nr:prepilin peptidase [Roseovarius sp. TE539]RBI76951.1 hypothetical protein DQW77_02865 [Roseovarius sp. TE539]